MRLTKEGGKKKNLELVRRSTTNFSVKNVFYIYAYIHAVCIEVEMQVGKRNTTHKQCFHTIKLCSVLFFQGGARRFLFSYWMYFPSLKHILSRFL